MMFDFTNPETFDYMEYLEMLDEANREEDN